MFRISSYWMGDDGIVAGNMRYTPEFRERAVRLLSESRASYSSETRAIAAVAADLGVSVESLRRWRNASDAKASADTAREETDALEEVKRLREENARLRRANEILTTAAAFFAARLDPTRR